MRKKIIICLSSLLCVLILLSSCDLGFLKIGDKELKPDMEKADMSKFVFLPEATYVIKGYYEYFFYNNSPIVETTTSKKASEIIKRIEKFNSEKISFGKSQYDECLNAFKSIIEKGTDSKITLAIAIDHSSDFDIDFDNLNCIYSRSLVEFTNENRSVILFSKDNMLEASANEILVRLAEYTYEEEVEKILVAPAPISTDRIKTLYNAVNDIPTDFYGNDYSKFKFIDDIIRIQSDKELSLREKEDAVEIFHKIEATNYSYKTITNRDDGAEYLNDAIEKGKGSDFALMVIIKYDRKPYGLYFEEAHCSKRHALYDESDNYYDLLLFTEEQINYHEYLEPLIKRLEKYTRYFAVEEIIVLPSPEIVLE